MELNFFHLTFLFLLELPVRGESLPLMQLRVKKGTVGACVVIRGLSPFKLS